MMSRSGEEEDLLRRTFELALRGKGKTAPNPMVGALVVRDGEIVGRGFHSRAGGPHAEVVALQDAGERSRGASLFVNLEPCNHHGNTPPCTDAIIEAGIRRVVCSMEDPNPKVRGSGLARLAEAGIEVSFGRLEAEAMRLNEVYDKNIRTGLPFVALKIAQSLDGRIAASGGGSRWITGGRSRREVHRLRAEHDAVMVGIGTVEVDDPLLTVRDVEGAGTPLRVVLDSRLRIPSGAKLLGGPPRTRVYTTVGRDGIAGREDLRREGVSVETVPGDGAGVDLEAVLRDLYRQGITSVLVEGGAGVFTSLLVRGLADKIHLFIGPVILGGGGALPSFRDLGISAIEDAIGVTVAESRRIGGDTLIVCYPANALAARGEVD
jgi:diaminohydroxyphosphoribosylaminopyrimidine deaminase/5-amino-6-(5-phosphoribosylamino)uracil reductase